MNEPTAFFGYRENQEAFLARFESFLNQSQALNGLFLQVDEKTRQPNNRSGIEFAVMYFLYRQVIEEFNAILILCANGFSRGATILLRSMYEHCITLKFFQMGYSGKIELKGDDVLRFIDYGSLTKRKKLQMFENAYDGDLSGEDFSHIEKAYEAVKEKFQITDCRKCGTEKTAFRWSKKDIVSMAEAVELNKELTFFCYTEALSYAHPSADYIEKRVQTDDEGNWSYLFESDADERKTLMFAHLMTLICSEAFLGYCGIADATAIVEPHAKAWGICWS